MDPGPKELSKSRKEPNLFNFSYIYLIFLLFLSYEERVLKYYDTQLALKGSMVLGKDLEVRLVDSKEVEGRPNAFEVSSGDEK